MISLFTKKHGNITMKDTHLQQSIDTWDTIAESFDKTRKIPWPFVTEFISSLSSESKIIDLGCGNGRHLIPAAKHAETTIGLDISRKMLEITQQKTNQRKLDNTTYIQATSYNLPLKTGSIDAALCIASLHNIRTRALRQQCMKEVFRILRINGKALISVWSREQDRFQNHIPNNNIKDKEPGDIEVDWKQDNLNIPRFYHLYGLREFKEDIQAGGFTIHSMQAEKISSKKEADNYFAIALKRK
jgi:ubiquinone/menaquinone biosynthesis C-methylase UbiE